MKAIIMAGGRGVRLHPYTKVLPKPLIPINDIPILEIILKQLKSFGFTDITLTLNYKGVMIQKYFGNGESLQLNIDYVFEKKPMGTIGSLFLIKNLKEPFLLLNADVLTDVNFVDFYNYHLNSDAIATIMLHRQLLNSEFGVVERNEKGELTAFKEKPAYSLLTSCGIYMVNPESLVYLKGNERIDAPVFFEILLKRKYIIQSYIHNKTWIDIGTQEGLRKATDEFVENPFRYLKAGDSCNEI